MRPIAPKPENLAQLVFFIRGEKVMLDADLARLYGVETGALNRAVKRNLGRFPGDFMFRFTSEDWENLRCQIGISSSPSPAIARGAIRVRRPEVFSRRPSQIAMVKKSTTKTVKTLSHEEAGSQTRSSQASTAYLLQSKTERVEQLEIRDRRLLGGNA